MSGVDDMSTQDVFGYFKEYPPAHIEWINDTACKSRTRFGSQGSGSGPEVKPLPLPCFPGNVVWLDDDTCIRALINTSRMPRPEAVTTETESGAHPDDPNKGESGPEPEPPGTALHSG